ncbi:MAG: response regulator transcription factor [Dehalococcoidales bacterium]
MSTIHVFIISQQILFRQGIEHSLSSVEDIEITGVTDISDEVLSTTDSLIPDVVLMDIAGSPDAGLALARRIKRRSPNIAVVVLSPEPSDSQLFQVLKAQAAAYLNKEISADELTTIIRRVAAGEHPINESLTTRPKVAEQVLNQFQDLIWKSEAEAFIAPLTARETDILKYMARGYLNKQIAVELGISEQTIKNHVTSILRKLNANARTEAVVVAIKQGLISLE